MNYPYYNPFAFTGGLPLQFLPPSPLLWYQGYPSPGPVPFPYHEQPLYINALANQQDCSRQVQQLQDATVHQHMHHQQQGPTMHGGQHAHPQAPLPLPGYTGPMPFNQTVYQGTPQAPQAAAGIISQPVSNAVMLARHVVHQHPKPALPQLQGNASHLTRPIGLLPSLSSQDIQPRLSTKSSVTAQQLLLNKGSLTKQQSVQSNRHVGQDAVPTVRGPMTQVGNGDTSKVLKTTMGEANQTNSETRLEDPFLEHLKTMPQLDGYDELMCIDEFRQIGPDTEIITFQQEFDSAVNEAYSFKHVADIASAEPGQELKAAMDMMCDDYM